MILFKLHLDEIFIQVDLEPIPDLNCRCYVDLDGQDLAGGELDEKTGSMCEVWAFIFTSLIKMGIRCEISRTSLTTSI